VRALENDASALLCRTATVLKLSRRSGIEVVAGVCDAEKLTCLVIQQGVA
jgi:hypothetical protein